MLSTELVNSEWQKGVKKDDLQTQNRWNLIEKQLSNYIAHDYIICLQELSIEWLTYLFPFFQQHHYSFIHGHVIDGKMSVGTAFPNSKFKLVSLKWFHVGSEIEKECKITAQPECKLQKIPKVSWILPFFRNIILETFSKFFNGFNSILSL